MIIFGTRGVKSTLSKGNFSCPQCAANRLYQHKKVTRFFTLYFVPLIPLGSAGEYVECQTCYGTFVPRVLDNGSDQSEKKFQAIYEEAMRHSMILMMLADGHIDPEEMETVQQIINKFGHNDVSMPELELLVERVQKENLPLSHYLTQVAPSLNEHGKEIIIKCAIAVASADGHIDESELQLISDMAKNLEMSNSHLKGIIHDMGLLDQNAFSNN